jgi:CDP-diacylglycerol--glycerol-3-phosphate 3-phosphatidyltransferase
VAPHRGKIGEVGERAAGRSGDDHVRDWAGLHHTEAPGGFVGGWLRAAGAVARPLARAGISPNAVTVAALVFALAAVPLALVAGWPGPAAACAAVTLSGLLDALDGAVAVQAGRATRVGFLLDSALDRLADAAMPAALAIVAGRGEWIAVAAVAAAWWLEYVRARGVLAESDGPGDTAGDRPGDTAGDGADDGAPQRQVVTPGERPTRIVLTAVGLGIPPLAFAALWGQVVIVGGSAGFLLVHYLRHLRRRDARPPPPAPRA